MLKRATFVACFMDYLIPLSQKELIFMKYIVEVEKRTSVSYSVEASSLEEAERIALKDAESDYEFNNDQFPTYVVTDLIIEEREV